jgi:hypothetical protein
MANKSPSKKAEKGSKKSVKATKNSTKSTKAKKNTKAVKKQTGGVPVTQKKRYFKCIYEEDGEVVCTGRYSGKKPKQAGNKALTALTKAMRKEGKDTDGVHINFCVIEQTRGSKRKKYFYSGVREELEDPVEVQITKKDKKTGKKVKETVTYRHSSTVKKVSADDCPELAAYNPREEDLNDNASTEQEGGNKKKASKKNAKKSTKKTTKKGKTASKSKKTAKKGKTASKSKKVAKKAEKKTDKKSKVKVAKKTSGKKKSAKKSN